MTDTKITRLTGLNIAALNEVLTDAEKRVVTIGKTTATFHMDAPAAVRLIGAVQQRAGADHGTTGHPYKSFHAIVRKLDSAVKVQYSENPLMSLHKDTVRSLVEQVRRFIDPYTRGYKTSPPERCDPVAYPSPPHTYVSGRDVEEWPGKLARFQERWERRPAEIRAAILSLAFDTEEETSSEQ